MLNKFFSQHRFNLYHISLRVQRRNILTCLKFDSSELSRIQDRIKDLNKEIIELEKNPEKYAGFFLGESVLDDRVQEPLSAAERKSLEDEFDEDKDSFDEDNPEKPEKSADCFQGESGLVDRIKVAKSAVKKESKDALLIRLKTNLVDLKTQEADLRSKITEMRLDLINLTEKIKHLDLTESSYDPKARSCRGEVLKFGI